VGTGLPYLSRPRQPGCRLLSRIPHFPERNDKQGLAYGPLPIWLYQAYLLFSHDVVALVAVRAVLVTTVTAVALLWLSRELSLWPWFAVALLLSPHLWFYARVIWDNTFNIPMSALAMAAFARLLRRPSRPVAAIFSFSLGAMLLTHLMSIPLVIALVGVLGALRSREMWAQRAAIAVGLLPLIAAGMPYWIYLARARPSGLGLSSAAGWLFPLDGARFLSAAAIENFFGSQWFVPGGSPLAAARALTLVAYPLCWMGAVFALLHLVKGLMRNGPLGPREGFCALLLAAFMGQVVLDGVTGTHHHTHYFSATWLVFGSFAWFAVESLPSVVRACVTAAYAATLAAVVAALGWSIHVGGGSRAVYGPTLSNQLAVADQLREYPPATPVQTDVPNLQAFPHSFAVLRRLRPPEPGRQAATPGTLWIRYRSNDPADARSELVEGDRS
jgi:hypothetical protein